MAKEGSLTIEVSQPELRIFKEAKRILQPYGLEVDAAARRLRDALNRIKGASLDEVVDFYLTHGKRLVVATGPTEPYQKYLDDLRRRGVGEFHLRDTKKFVGKYVVKLPAYLTLQTIQIDEYLASMGGKARNKNNARDKIIAFYNFLQQKGYLPNGIDHPAKGTTRYVDPRPEITNEEDAAASATATDIYTPEEMKAMIEVADPDEKVTVELKGFSGLRTEELVRLWSVLIDEAERQINLSAAIAKLDQRTIPIVENLRRRLADYPPGAKAQQSLQTTEHFQRPVPRLEAPGWLSGSAVQEEWVSFPTGSQKSTTLIESPTKAATHRQ